MYRGYQTPPDEREPRRDLQGILDQPHITLSLSPPPPAAVPRGRRLEIFIPSEHFAVTGGLYLCGPAFLPYPHQVDAQWEHYGVRKVKPRGKQAQVGESSRCLVFLLLVLRTYSFVRPRLA